MSSRILILAVHLSLVVPACDDPDSDALLDDEGVQAEALAAESPVPYHEGNKVQYGVLMNNGRYKFLINGFEVEISVTTYQIGEGPQPAFGYISGPNNNPSYGEIIPPKNYFTVGASACKKPYSPPTCKSLCCEWGEVSTGRYLYREVVNGNVRVLTTTQPLPPPNW